MAGIARYPKEFTASDTGNHVDYMVFSAVRKDYTGSTTTNDGFAVDSNFPGDANKVVLYMPQKITENYSQGWTNNTLGPEVGRLLSTDKDKFSGLGGQMVRRLIEEYAMNQAIEGAGKLGASSLTANAILSASGGIIYNPMMEVLYDGPDFRRFNYEFTLFAKSEDDAKEIYKIVNFFRYCSVPSSGNGVSSNVGGAVAQLGAVNAVTSAVSATTGTQLANAGTQGLTSLLSGAAASVGGFFGGDNRFIKQPAFIQVDYKRNSNKHPFILSPKPCALQSLNIDFTPTGSYTMLDNTGTAKVATVVATTISFSLTEIKALYSEDLDTLLA